VGKGLTKQALHGGSLTRRYGLHYRAVVVLGREGEAGLPNQLWRDLLLQGGDGDHFYTEETNDKLGDGLEFFF
jgi:hypothetical protein